MMNITALLTFVILTAFTPGPNNIMSMSLANLYGFRGSLRFIYGVFAGFVVLIIICGIFNLFLFTLLPVLVNIAGIAGGVYMVWLAASLLITKSGNDYKGEMQGGSFISGMMLQFINPKVYVYGLTAHSVFLLPYSRSVFIMIMFSVFLSLFAFVATLTWAFSGSIMQKFFSEHKKKINALMACSLIYCAVSVSGILKLF